MGHDLAALRAAVLNCHAVKAWRRVLSRSEGVAACETQIEQGSKASQRAKRQGTAGQIAPLKKHLSPRLNSMAAGRASRWPICRL